MAEIDEHRSNLWAMAYRGSIGNTPAGAVFELVNRVTLRAHTVFWYGGGGPISMSVAIPGIVGCPNYTAFETRNRVSFDDFDGKQAFLQTKAIPVAFRHWIQLSIMFDRRKYDQATVKWSEWGIDASPIYVGIEGRLYVKYGNGQPSCADEHSWVNVDTEEDPVPIKIPFQVSQKNDAICIDIPADILFPFDRPKSGEAWDFERQPEAKKALTEAARLIRATPTRRALVSGHTDSIGDAKYNQELSERRAAAVVRWLTDPAKGKVKVQDVKPPQGWGESNPVVDNKNDAPTEANKKAQAANRRVQICLFKR